MNLVISSITMVDLTNKEAKRIHFSPGKNLITSAHNHLGKSVIMKSIYYTLGAEVYYPTPIKRINLLTYIDFNLGQHQYRVARLKNAFTLYCDGTYVESFPSVGLFGESLCELFRLEIDLVGKDQDGTITKCPPAFYYMPYYVDQENGWSANSFSFDRMTQFDLPQRKSSFFFHFGVLDKTYVEISKRNKANARQIEYLIKENEKYLAVIDVLRSRIDDTELSFDTISLEKAISHREDEIKRLLHATTKIRADLIRAEDQLSQVVNEKDILSKYIKKKPPRADEEQLEYVECPRCGLIYEQGLRRRLEKVYLLESLHDDYIVITTQQASLEKRIQKLREEFRLKERQISDYEESLGTDRETYDAYVKSKATNQLLRDYQEKIGANEAEIAQLRKDNMQIHHQLEDYEKERTSTNHSYLGNLSKLLVSLDIPSDQVEDNSEPGSTLVASGAYGPRCKISQMLAFVETQHEIAPNIISFPLVIDSPNVLEQDNEHLDTVIRTLLTWDRSDNQIIVASIQGKETAQEISGSNIIVLSNDKNHLFNSEEYTTYEDEISDIFLQF